MLPPSVMIDIVIAAVLVLCIFLGKKRGLFRSLMSLVVVIVALVTAAKAADFGTEFVIETFLRPAAAKAMEQRIDEMMSESIAATSPLEEMEKVVDAIPNGFIREKAGQLLGELGLSAESMPSYSGRETLLKVGGELLDGVLDTAVYSMLHALLYVLAFFLVMLILRLLIGAVDLTLHLPLLRQANQFFGLLFGAVEGVVLVCMGVFLLSQLSPWVTPETVEESILLKIAVQWLDL